MNKYSMRTCPECGREFRRKTRHTCARYELSDHTAKMTLSQEATFDALCKVVDDLPDVVYDPVKSGIELRVDGALFVMIKRVTGILRVSLLHETPLHHPRVHKSYQASKRRCYNDVDLATPEDVDQEFTGWLLLAHSLFSGVSDADWA